MKRTLILTTAFVLVLALLFAGCAQKASDEADVSGQVDDTHTDTAEDTDSEDGQDDTHAASEEKTPAGSYERYIEAKTAGYDSISAMIEEDDTLALTAGLQLMAVAMVDLTALDISFISSDTAASETAASIMGVADLDITYSGEDFNMSYTGSNGTVVVAGQYDGATDSLTATWTVAGSETMAMEYVTYKSGYAGQYLVYNSDATTSVIKVIVDGADMGFGLSEGDSLTTIYKTAPADFSFLDDCATIVSMQDGEGVSVIDGETTTF